jgi:hypothetical protein
MLCTRQKSISHSLEFHLSAAPHTVLTRSRLLSCCCVLCCMTCAAAAIVATVAQLLTVVGPVKSRPGLGRLDVAGFILAALLVVMHGVASFWQDQEIRIMGSATKTGKIAFTGALMRMILVVLCCGTGAIWAAGPYW